MAMGPAAHPGPMNIRRIILGAPRVPAHPPGFCRFCRVRGRGLVNAIGPGKLGSVAARKQRTLGTKNSGGREACDGA